MIVRLAAVLLGGLLILPGSLIPGTAESATAKTACLVCKVTKGETGGRTGQGNAHA